MSELNSLFQGFAVIMTPMNLGLMVLGIVAPGPLTPAMPWLTNELVAMVGTLVYFGFFLLMPWWSQLGTPKPVPERVTFKPH
mgnify:CR=1 FL=1